MVFLGLMCGLRPRHFITLASPHCGVGHSLAGHLQFLSYFFGGRTAEQLLGWDDYAYLESILSDDHLAALEAFDQRTLYAHLLNDNRVDYASAALLLAPLSAHHDDKKIDWKSTVLDTRRPPV